MEREGRRYICLKAPFEICAGLVVVQTASLAYHTILLNNRQRRSLHFNLNIRVVMEEGERS